MDFDDRLGRMSERERIAMLRTFDEVVPKIICRSGSRGIRSLSLRNADLSRPTEAV